MNMHVAALTAEQAADFFERRVDPMLAAVERWRAANRALVLACEDEDDEELIDVCLTADCMAMTAVMRTTANSDAGWRALLGLLADTCGEARRADFLACISRSYAAIHSLTPEHEL